MHWSYVSFALTHGVVLWCGWVTVYFINYMIWMSVEEPWKIWVKLTSTYETTSKQSVNWMHNSWDVLISSYFLWDYYFCKRSVLLGHVFLVAITGTTILVPYLLSQVTATHAKKGHLWICSAGAPSSYELQRDLTKWVGTSLITPGRPPDMPFELSG